MMSFDIPSPTAAVLAQSSGYYAILNKKNIFQSFKTDR
jgi:hypothetical protein